MTRKDCSTMTDSEMRAALDEACRSGDSCRLAAGLAKGRDKRRFEEWARQHDRNARVLADSLYGAPDASILAMSVDELMAELAP